MIISLARIHALFTFGVYCNVSSTLIMTKKGQVNYIGEVSYYLEK
jgi:hypothetical protein